MRLSVAGLLIAMFIIIFPFIVPPPINFKNRLIFGFCVHVILLLLCGVAYILFQLDKIILF